MESLKAQAAPAFISGHGVAGSAPTTDAPRDRPVQHSVGRLNEAALNMARRVEALEKALDLILTPEPPVSTKNAVEKEPQQRPSLANSVIYNAEIIERVTMRIESILNRIEL